MANGISDKSRHFSLLALNELEKVAQKYASVPKIKTLSEEQISWLNERIRSFHESVVKINYKRFSFLSESKAVRNAIAHSTAELSKAEIEVNWQKFFDFAGKAKSELQKNVEKSYSDRKEIRKFEKFGSSKFGNELERKQLSQALADEMDLSLPSDEKLNFAENQAAAEAKKFFQTETPAQKDLLNFAKKHKELNQQIQSEILETLQTAYDETEITNPENPFYDENIFVGSLQNLSAENLLKNLSDIQNQLNGTETGGKNSANFDFYKKQYEHLLKQLEPVEKTDAKQKLQKLLKMQKKPDSHDFEILARNLKADLQKSLTDRYTAWQLEEIDKKRKEYLEELYKKIAQFKKIEEQLSPFIKKFGRLWDLSQGAFNDYGFEILKEFADILENDESLKELADLIGRQTAETERYEKELREKTEIKTEYHPKPAYRGQISGLRLSGEITSALPSELAMSKNPATQRYFAQKFAEKKLLSYAYINRTKSYRTEKKTEEVQVPVKEKEQKGPVIICVDTSGSMGGTPERVAKTITFALAKKCIEEERGCYLISFSSGIEVKNLCEFEKSNGLAELINFLRMSFNGGTDAEPALVHSLEMLEKNEWKNADILVVSDMIMGEFSENMKKDIKAQQQKETKFYSLVIGDSGNQNVIDAFNENWAYNANARDAMHHLVRQIKQIR